MMKTVHLSFISYICALFQPTKSDCCQMTNARLGFKKNKTKHFVYIIVRQADYWKNAAQ